ncbi:transketolase [Patescibacteria group bacterium]|nr:transketolase [Patescibacteria group bacterium]
MSKTKKEFLQLELKSYERRLKILDMILCAGGSHIPCALSIIDIITCLYGKVLNIDARNPKDPRRDKFVLSKGHGVAALYVVLSEMGFFPESELKRYCSVGGILGGHPDSTKVPGIEASTGSLGHGFSVAVGFALANKIDEIESSVYCLVGDGECNEGSIWEAAMSAAHYNLDNLTLIIDNNKLQISGFTKDVLDPLSFVEKFNAFGFNTVEIDGHSFEEISNAFEKKFDNGKPKAIVANTVKGKGISYMENERKWHGMFPIKEEAKVAKNDLENKVHQLEGLLK